MSVNRLLGMALLHFVAMYVLMYSMVNTFDNVYPNLNNAYMAGIMTAPMLITEAFLMGSMYKDRLAVRIFGIIGVIILVTGFIFIRQQTLIQDGEFIRSMIPHHSGAILMCEKAKIEDIELQELCGQIIISQRDEIEQMERILSRLD